MKPNASPKQVLTNKQHPSQTLLAKTREHLADHSESPYLDSLELLSHLTGIPRSRILAHPNPKLSPQQRQDLESALQELRGGTPLPYVLGKWEFFQLSYQVTPDVLIPRPETEGLVELALEWLKNHPGHRSCLEVGTGSGCIAVTLTRMLPALQVTATDISPKALAIARENAQLNGVEGQVEFLERDLLAEISGGFDLLIANLPYIPTEKLKTLAVYQSEPTLALDGGQDGLRLIKKFLQGAPEHVNAGGAILLELDEDTGATALALARNVFPGAAIQLGQDLSGQDRYLSIQCQ